MAPSPDPSTRQVRLRRALPDGRSGRVVFVSHCLLNQNTRYLGGAVCPGVVAAATEPYVRDGVGLVQMPCPEQQVWGGVLKRQLLWLLDHPRTTRSGRVLLPAVRAYLRWRYRRLARLVAVEIEEYLRSGLEVEAVVGVAGSPSCGVATTVDLAIAGRAIGARTRDPVSVRWMNEEVVARATVRGQGLFVDAVTRELDRRGLAVPVREHDLSTTGPAGIKGHN